MIVLPTTTRCFPYSSSTYATNLPSAEYAAKTDVPAFVKNVSFGLNGFSVTGRGRNQFCTRCAFGRSSNNTSTPVAPVKSAAAVRCVLISLTRNSVVESACDFKRVNIADPAVICCVFPLLIGGRYKLLAGTLIAVILSSL